MIRKRISFSVHSVRFPQSESHGQRPCVADSLHSVAHLSVLKRSLAGSYKVDPLWLLNSDTVPNHLGNPMLPMVAYAAMALSDVPVLASFQFGFHGSQIPCKKWFICSWLSQLFRQKMNTVV